MFVKSGSCLENKIDFLKKVVKTSTKTKIDNNNKIQQHAQASTFHSSINRMSQKNTIKN